MHTREKNTRRYLLRSATALGTGLVLGGCGSERTVNKQSGNQAPSAKAGSETGIEVTAVEDLMREHGVLRRALFIYSEAAARLRSDSSAVPPEALQKTARLFRTFGEDYHERLLEEGVQKFLFPAELGTGRFMRIGIPAPEIMAPFDGAFEIVCGVLILVGLLTLAWSRM